ncbi:MAG: hypothetical protein CMJ32_09310, partial [Phycisphaerae bacterium]|nr:hypothetical protein [Phycisphaerae bacterium]
MVTAKISSKRTDKSAKAGSEASKADSGGGRMGMKGTRKTGGSSRGTGTDNTGKPPAQGRKGVTGKQEASMANATIDDKGRAQSLDRALAQI